jgi:hypothetical protein
MTGGANGLFVSKHTYDISESIDNTLGADTLNRAAQKALGDKKGQFDVIFMHSAISTNLEGLNLINFLKYTDSQGIERELTIGQFNGKLVIVDDEVQELNGYDAAESTTPGALEVVASGASDGEINLADVKKGDFYPASVKATDYVVAGTKYISYVFKNGFFEYEDIGATTPSEIVRDAYGKGGKNDLISRIREMIVPTYISYKGTGTVSPENSDFENGSNWELANNDKSGANKVYVDDKLIPVARIISRG